MHSTAQKFILFLNKRFVSFELSFRCLCCIFEFGSYRNGPVPNASRPATTTNNFQFYSFLFCEYTIPFSYITFHFKHTFNGPRTFFGNKITYRFHMVAETICHYAINLSKACSIKTLIAATLATISFRLPRTHCLAPSPVTSAVHPLSQSFHFSRHHLQLMHQQPPTKTTMSSNNFTLNSFYTNDPLLSLSCSIIIIQSTHCPFTDIYIYIFKCKRLLYLDVH